MMRQSLLLLAGMASLARASAAGQAKHARQESITPNPSATRTSLPAFDSTGTATTIGPCEWNLRIFLLGTQPTLAPEAAEWFASSIATRSTSPVTHTSQIPSVCSSLINYPNTFTAPPAVKSQYSSWLGEHSSWVDDKKSAASSILSGCTSAQFASLSHSALEALATDIKGCERHQSAVLLYTTPSSTGGPPTPTATSDGCGLALRSIASSKPTQAPEFADWYSSSIVNEISGILTQTTASVESITHVDQLSSLCTKQFEAFQAYPTTFTAAPEIKSYYSSYRSAQSAWVKDNEAFVRSVVYTACPSAPPVLRANAFRRIATDVAGCVELYRLMGLPAFATETSTFGVTRTTGTAAQQTTNTAGTTRVVTGGAARETGYVVAAVAVAAAAVAAL